MTSSAEKIDEALRALREVVAEVVRDEQLRDQLTKLGNDHALTEWIKTTMARQTPFWIAFLEVDRFKEINDVFGYTNADTLLKRIAEQLTTASSYFPQGVTAFRAHGDEFYLAGALVEDEEGSGPADGIGRRKPNQRSCPRGRGTVSEGLREVERRETAAYRVRRLPLERMMVQTPPWKSGLAANSMFSARNAARTAAHQTVLSSVSERVP